MPVPLAADTTVAVIETTRVAVHVALNVPPGAIKVVLPPTPFFESQLAGVIGGVALTAIVGLVGWRWRKHEEKQRATQRARRSLLVELPLIHRGVMRVREALDPDGRRSNEGARDVLDRLNELNLSLLNLDHDDLDAFGGHDMVRLSDCVRRAHLLVDEAKNAKLVNTDYGAEALRAPHPPERSEYRMRFMELEHDVGRIVRRVQAKWGPERPVDP